MARRSLSYATSTVRSESASQLAGSHPVDERLDAVEYVLDAEQELLAFRLRAFGPRRPGDPVQPRVGLLVDEFPQQRLERPRRSGLDAARRCLIAHRIGARGAERVMSHPG